MADAIGVGLHNFGLLMVCGGADVMANTLDTCTTLSGPSDGSWSSNGALTSPLHSAGHYSFAANDMDIVAPQIVGKCTL